jgi:hypothetical protein
VEEMGEAIQAYKHITVTPEFKEAERLRAKARTNEAVALAKAVKNRDFELDHTMLERKEPIEKIIEYTQNRLTRVEIEELQQPTN